jgi:hypothetical protein
MQNKDAVISRAGEGRIARGVSAVRRLAAASPRLAGSLVRKLKTVANPVVDISNEYTELLTGVNAGYLERGNLYCFDYAVRNLPGEFPLVEIGSFCGLSTNLLTYYKAVHGAKNRLVNCDKWKWGDTGNVGDSSFTYDEYLAFVRESYVRNVRTFSRSDLPYTIEEFSADFFARWRGGEEATDVFGRAIRLGGPISFCYIDGNHAYEYAKRDFEDADEFLVPGGFILFDDSADGTHWDVARVRDEVIASGRYEVAAKNPNYLFRKK